MYSQPATAVAKKKGPNQEGSSGTEAEFPQQKTLSLEISGSQVSGATHSSLQVGSKYWGFELQSTSARTRELFTTRARKRISILKFKIRPIFLIPLY
jgi:hypothetical protein